MKLDIHNIRQGGFLKESQEALFEHISSSYFSDETAVMKELYSLAYVENEQSKIRETTAQIIEQVRSSDRSLFFDIEDLLQEYSLSDEDGVTLMCLAEALLRIPDDATIDSLIKDKLSDKEWSRHLDKDNSLFVNASTWGLVVAGSLVNVGNDSVSTFFKNSTKPVIRKAVDRAMRIMGQHFVLGRTIKEAMKNARPYIKKGYDYSYDMLGESAITAKEAEKYFLSYSDSIAKIADNSKDSSRRPSLSIKLSALHPRFEETQRDRVLTELGSTVESLVKLGISHDVGITIDAEEADRMELTLALFESIYKQPFVRNWGKFGLVIQAYSKRALPALCWLTKLAKTHGDEIPLRLVKGAYWDTEIQHSQVLGMAGYPVFTRKEYTDTAYLACARYLLSDVTRNCIYPQFASHNAHTVSSIKVMAPAGRNFEFQRLHGMGDGLYESLLALSENIQVRIYAPVGSHEDLLPYLVRRLLENGANSSFVHQLSDEDVSVDELSQRPLTFEEIDANARDEVIPKPNDIFAKRKNSSGINLTSLNSRHEFIKEVSKYNEHSWNAAPIINGEILKVGEPETVFSPFDNSLSVGTQYEATEDIARQALDAAEKAFPEWLMKPVEERSQILELTADLIEQHSIELIALCQREAGKTFQDGIDEVREAVDFCRYYAQQAREKFGTPISLFGPTGESNDLIFEGRGVFVCISPWNFPLAIYMGQIAAALVSGNTLIVKPAETTTLVAYRAIQLLFEAGLPKQVLQFIPGSGSKLGAVLNADPRVVGVVFTGSNATARAINLTLANRDRNAGIATFIAETGGLNAMLVDSTSLPEQVARDVVHSAFGSAGQRCSALRVLYVQNDIADRVIELVKGMMSELRLGNPQLLLTDVGPVIDSNAQSNLLDYIEKTKAVCKDFFQIQISDELNKGTFVAPTLFEINSIAEMEEEQFGPILHVVRYAANKLEQIVDDINAKGYGLTFGIHTRNTTVYEYLSRRLKVGNIYINRDQVGAVVGVNPFGGCGLSGTGPKAGGPHYLLRFATEKTVTNNMAAIGGNIDLLNTV